MPSHINHAGLSYAVKGRAAVLGALIAAAAGQVRAEVPKTGDTPPADSAAEHSMYARARGGTKSFYDANHFDLSGLPAYQPEQKVSGNLRIWGNNYINDSPLGARWKAEFEKFHPGIHIEYNLPSAAIAAPALYFDLADIGMNHDPTFYDYLAFERIKGYPPTVISAVTGSYNLAGWQNSIVIVVNRNNPLPGITLEQLDGVFGGLRDGGWIGTAWHPEFSRGADKNIRTWGALGLKGEWAHKHIDVYGYTPRYATSLEFSNKVLGGSDKWNEDLHAVGNYRRPDNTIYTEAEQLIDRTEADPQAITMVRYTDAISKRLKVLAIAPHAGAPFVPYTLETVQNRSYPLWGDQSFIVAAKPGTPIDAKIREFIRFALSRDGQRLVAEDGKYLPLTPEAAHKSLELLDKISGH